MNASTLMRLRILELAYRAGSNGAHIGGSLSLVEILQVLYNHNLDLTPSNPNRDRVILSKGHGALALYCILEQKGILSSDKVDSFESNGSNLFAHAKRNVDDGIEFSGGSLSLGVSYAVGVALACRSKQINNRIIVIIGDGECNEGLVWEAVMSAAHYHLDNITFIVDRNGLQSDGLSDLVMKTESLEQKFESFGCIVSSVDGHNLDELRNALDADNEGRPKAIVARTVKGKGVSFLENQPSSHHIVLNSEQYERAKRDVYSEI